ncbi:cilia- and flagella-associated protein 299 [Pimephales promelas]|uniref:cilia- and flagella-associated protein 299 n=1 Tax=Pimephales promelas TaxID=90988 RepID=UPI0019554949|nr:cilia- and flagella-associated protein 299 [Pimephales promelas]KAG1937390.1 cilia- and flagella-associated protein [Pimephales promelas]
MEDDIGAFAGETVEKFRTYEDFLDSQIKPLDLFYLQDQERARQLVELGLKGSNLTREEFETRKAAAEASRLASGSQQKKLASTGKELKDNFLRALAEREEANRSGKMTSIIFIRDRNSRGQEISAYIDYSHRLKSEDFEPYFSGKKRFLPKTTDLSFYNWRTQVAKCNASSNYEVITENPSGLLFQCRNNMKILNVDPEAIPGDGFTRTPVRSDLYEHVVIFDHVIRKLVTSSCAPLSN